MLLQNSVIALRQSGVPTAYFSEVCALVTDRFPGHYDVIDQATPGVTNPSIDGPTLVVDSNLYDLLTTEGICPKGDFESWKKHNFDILTGTSADYESYQLDCYDGVWPVETIDITEPIADNVISKCVSAQAGSKITFATGSLGDVLARAFVRKGLMGVEFVVQGGNTIFERYEDQ